MRAQPVAQGVIHARLPAIAGGTESVQDLGVVPDADELLAHRQLRAASPWLHLVELLVAGHERVSVCCDPTRNRCLFLRGVSK